MPGTAPARPSKSRRSSAELDGLILGAARELFASRGYGSTTTREIAARAGVHEPMLYRRYGSKAGLFRVAVLVPFGEVIDGYLKTWEAQRDEPVSLRELVTAFVEPLYALFRQHNELALALIQARGAVPESDDPLVWPAELGALLAELAPQLELEGARRGLNVDPSTTNVVVLGMVLGLSLLDPLLPASAATPRTAATAMIDLILRGVSPVPEPGSDTVVATYAYFNERVVTAERRAARAEVELERCREQLRTITLTTPDTARTTRPLRP